MSINAPKIGQVVVPYISSQEHENLMAVTLITISEYASPIDYRVHVVNHASNETIEKIKIQYKFDKLIINENCLASAWNKGINGCLDSDCEYIVIPNLDIEFRSDTVDNLVKFAKENQEYNGKRVLMWGGLEIKDKSKLNDSLPSESISEGAGFWFYMIHRDLFKLVGEFDENFKPAYFEDNDMAYRIKLAGYTSLTSNQVQAFHYGSSTLNNDAELAKTMPAFFEKNKEYYIKKWGGLPEQERYDVPFNQPLLGKVTGKSNTWAYQSSDGVEEIVIAHTEDSNETPIKKSKTTSTSRKIRLLAWCDSPLSTTGFGTVAKGVLKGLADTGNFDITVVTNNHDYLWYDQTKHPYKIYGVQDNHLHGAYGEKILETLIATEDFDMLWAMNDPKILLKAKTSIRLGHSKGMKSVFYMPIDTDYFAEVYEEAAMMPTHCVFYHRGARKLVTGGNAILRQTSSYIHHGTDVRTFTPIDDFSIREFRRKYFGIGDDALLVSWVGRNQWRKDPMAAVQAFYHLNMLLKVDEAIKEPKVPFLYMHCAKKDIGGNLAEQIEHFDWAFKQRYHESFMDQIILAPKAMDEAGAVSLEDLNSIYNASDLLINTSLGEGWGLTVTEAMACMTPVLVPANTSFKQIVGQARGLVSSTEMDYSVAYGYNEFPRLRIDIQAFAQAMSDALYKMDDEYKAKMIQEAYKWVQGNTWDEVSKKWQELIYKILG